MEKVKVNKEIFDALENLMKREQYGFGKHKDYMLKNKAFRNFTNERMVLNEMNDFEFAKCIILGYELEEKKEEKLLSIYKNHDNHYAYGFGIKKALEVLDIEIKGINC